MSSCLAKNFVSPVRRNIITARMAMAAMAKMPTRNCAQPTFCAVGIDSVSLFYRLEFGNIRVGGMVQLILGAFENQTSFAEHHESCTSVNPIPVAPGALQVAALGI